MIDEARLAELMRVAIEDKYAEPALLRALLSAKVYAHILRNDPSPRLRLIQFTLPTGQLALPFFSEKAQAVVAAGRTARVVAMTGRQLFELTRGATLVLNPNSTYFTLYPEEIEALLERDEVAIIEKIQLTDPSIEVSVPEQMPGWLLEPLIALYVDLKCVESAYLAEVRSPANPDTIGLLIVLEVKLKDAERAARATTTTLQPRCDHEARSVDLTTIEPGKPPQWLAELNVKPFFDRHVRDLWQASTTGSKN